jgi:glyoxylase-like metal-dependent hydrolase (beta-lactamase superfamily II)
VSRSSAAGLCVRWGIIPRIASSPPSTESYALAAAAGIYPLALDTPFAIGTVNTYLIEDDPLTLIDCGPNTATGLSQLEELLAARGHSLTDLELVVVTHEHIDHTGLAGVIAERSGAELACIDLLAPTLEKWNEYSIARDDYALALMLRHGVEPHVAEALRAVANITRGFGAHAHPDRRLSADSSLSLGGRSLKVLHRPGHSQSDTVFHDHASKVAFLGDHLLAHISPNALVDHPMAGDSSRRAEPLLDYRRSLQETRQLEIEVGLTGHGVPVVDHRTLIDKSLRAQERRAEHFYELLADGPLTAHELASLRWGGVATTQAFLTLSEVLGHLGLLLTDGLVIEDTSAEIVHFEQLH